MSGSGRGVCLAVLLGLLANGARADQRASEVFTRAGASVVTVTQRGNELQAIGSGIVVGDGRVSTNYHVVANDGEILVHYRGESYRAQIEKYAEPQDLALLSVSGLHAPTVQFGRGKGLEMGQSVYALGSPRGLELTLSEGIVSGLRSNGVIQMTTPISPGSSGGGLFDDQGRLIGIPTLQVKEAQNLNFAAPVEWLTALGVDISVAASAVQPPKPPAPPVEERPATAAPPAVQPPPAVVVETQPVPETPPETPLPVVPGPTDESKSISYFPWLALLALLIMGWWLWARSQGRHDGAPPASAPRENKLMPFEKAARQELTANQTDPDLWLQALQRSAGNETAAKVLYIRLRAEQLYKRELDQRWAQAVAQSGGTRTSAAEPPQVSKP